MSQKLVNEIKQSEYFDADWYVNEYTDVKELGLCPAEHFSKYGWKLGRNPSAKFSTKKYLEHHQDVLASGVNPLVHYIRHGKQEGRILIPNTSSELGLEIDCASIKNIDLGASVLNEYFDHVYVVNLERSVKERIRITSHLNKLGVKHELWKATDGYKNEPLKKYEEYSERQLGTLKRFSDFNDRELARGKGFIESAGAIGYIYTYISILKDALENGYDKFLILEDDVILSNNFDRDFKRFVAELPQDWKVLQLGASQYGWSSFDEDDATDKGYYFPRRLDTCGSFSIALRGEIIPELIELESSFEAPFDHLPLGAIYEKYLGSCFVSFPNIVMPDVTDSEIRGGRDQFSHAEKMKWLPSNFEFPLRAPSVSILVTSKLNLKYADSFKAPKNSSLNIRFYGFSGDGIRPIHNFDDLSWLQEPLDLIGISLPESDFYLVANTNSVVVEEDVESFVLSKLSSSCVYSGTVTEVDVNNLPVSIGRVSVIIPTYKRPTNLLNALTSVAEQDYVNKEIIVVNDTGAGSKYNTEISNVIQQVQGAFPLVDIKFIEHKKNRNGAAARNTGLMASTGEYISYLDDDDIYLQGRLSETVNKLANQPGQIGAVYCGFLGWNSPKNDLNRYAEGDLTKEILLLEYLKHYVHTNTVTYKRSAVLALNGFDESYRRHQDLEFNLRFFELFEICAVHDALVRLNPAPSDISNKVFNIEMLKLKEKFLGQFVNTISGFEKSVEKGIYDKHWGEVSRYISDHGVINEYIINDWSNGPAQIASKSK